MLEIYGRYAIICMTDINLLDCCDGISASFTPAASLSLYLHFFSLSLALAIFYFDIFLVCMLFFSLFERTARIFYEKWNFKRDSECGIKGCAIKLTRAFLFLVTFSFLNVIMFDVIMNFTLCTPSTAAAFHPTILFQRAR